MRIGALGVLVLVVLALAACGGGDGDEPFALSVTLNDDSIAVSQEIAPPGEMLLTIENQGSAPHDLVIIKSDLPPLELPTAGGAIDEAAVNIIGRIEPLAPGSTETLTIELTAGKYLLVDSIVEAGESNYLNGMTTPLLLEDD